MVYYVWMTYLSFSVAWDCLHMRDFNKLSQSGNCTLVLNLFYFKLIIKTWLSFNWLYCVDNKYALIYLERRHWLSNQVMVMKYVMICYINSIMLLCGGFSFSRLLFPAFLQNDIYSHDILLLSIWHIRVYHYFWFSLVLGAVVVVRAWYFD